MHFPTKSEVAFRFSAERLFEQYSEVYFWTFTNRKAVSDWQAGTVWNRFSKDLQDLYGGLLRGLKVIELHETHGIHWHCLLNKRVWVGEVRRLGKRYGIGRVHVQRADQGSIGYLAKYLGKDLAREKLHVRTARWGCVGGFVGVPVGRIKADSRLTRALPIYQRVLGSKVPFRLIKQLGAQLDSGEFHDDDHACAAALWRFGGRLDLEGARRLNEARKGFQPDTDQALAAMAR